MKPDREVFVVKKYQIFICLLGHIVVCKDMHVKFHYSNSRFRGLVKDGGFGENGEFLSVQGEDYLRVMMARLAFVLVFEVSNSQVVAACMDRAKLVKHLNCSTCDIN